MTQPAEILYASEQYQKWLTALKDQAMLATHNQSQAMMRAVMHVLRRYLSTEKVMKIANALPPLPRGIFIEGWHPKDTHMEFSSISEFTNAVANNLSPHQVPPQSIVTDVFKVLADHSERANAEVLRDSLPHKLKPYWPH
jgi:uncharacterized protein (DUF2267 family)